VSNLDIKDELWMISHEVPLLLTSDLPFYIVNTWVIHALTSWV